jgi:VWFA-related protein
VPIRYKILILLLSSAAAAAQLPATAPTQPTSPQSGTPLHIDVLVDTKSGPLTGLTQQDFVLRDNKAVQPITSLRPVSGLSEVVLLIDAVNIDQRVLGQERQEIDKFLTSHGGELAFPTTLAILQDTGVQIQKTPTRDGNALKASLDKAQIGLREIRRSTGIYGADDRLGISLNALRSVLTRESAMPGRKLILFVSPGWPVLSGPRIDLDSRQQNQIFADVTGFYNLFRNGHTTLYSIDPLGAGENLGRENYYEAYLPGVPLPVRTDLGDLSLQVLAVHSGGSVLNGNNYTAALLQQAIRDSSEAYELTYTPPPNETDDPKHPFQYHHIELMLENSDAKPRTIDGYYNHP